MLLEGVSHSKAEQLQKFSPCSPFFAPHQKPYQQTDDVASSNIPRRVQELGLDQGLNYWFHLTAPSPSSSDYTLAGSEVLALMYLYLYLPFYGPVWVSISGSIPP